MYKCVSATRLTKCMCMHVKMLNFSLHMSDCTNFTVLQSVLDIFYVCPYPSLVTVCFYSSTLTVL